MTESLDQIKQKALELCWKIETLPASELQTEISIMASDLHSEIKQLNEGLEEISKLADTADNLLAATNLPVSDRIHLQGLREGLGGISAKLKDVYVELSGSNPWTEA